MINEPLPPEYSTKQPVDYPVRVVRRKRPRKSKTLWVNGLTLVVALLALAAGDPIFTEYSKYIVFIQAALNIVLRVVTQQPLDTPNNRP